MDTRGHYAHLLLMVALGATLFYAVLRQWLPILPALFSAVALLLGKPTFHIAAGLMHGHYATGFVFSMLTILGWVRYLKGGHWYWLLLAALTYLLATTCKEIYVPLVVLLPFLPIGTWRQRWRALLPFVAIAAIYAGWRYMMLGRLIGGYKSEAFDATNALYQFARIPRLLFGSKLIGIFILFLYIGLFYMAVRKQRLNWLLLAIAAACIFLPLLPLTASPGIHQADRYLFALWLALCACLAVILPRHINSISASAVYISLLFLLTLTHLQIRNDMAANLNYWHAMYRFALSADSSKEALFIGQDHTSYKRDILTSIRKASNLFTGSPAENIPLKFIDATGNGLSAIDTTQVRIFEYNAGKIIPMSEDRFQVNVPRHQDQRPDGDNPLDVELFLSEGLLHWKFGPYDGNYLVRHFSPTSSYGEFILPREGKTAWLQSHALRISICYDNAAQGISGCSPVVDFDFRSSQTATWHGVIRRGAIP